MIPTPIFVRPMAPAMVGRAVDAVGTSARRCRNNPHLDAGPEPAPARLTAYKVLTENINRAIGRAAVRPARPEASLNFHSVNLT